MVNIHNDGRLSRDLADHTVTSDGSDSADGVDGGGVALSLRLVQAADMDSSYLIFEADVKRRRW